MHATRQREGCAKRRSQRLFALCDPGHKGEGDLNSRGCQAAGCASGLREPLQEISFAPDQGFCVGRTSTSLTNDCGACVTNIATMCATSSASSILDLSFPSWGLNSVSTDPGQTTETRIPYPRSSSATE